MAKKRKAKDRFHGLKPHIKRLYKAVENYVLREKGTILVIGGIQIIQWPQDGEFRYTIGVPCTGRRPVFTRRDAAGRTEK